MNPAQFSGDDLFEFFQAMSEKIKALPEPVAYIVLDHSWSASLPLIRDLHKHRAKVHA